MYTTNDPKWSSYRSSIEVLAKVKSKKVFLNSGPEIAASVLATLFRHTEDEILIYSGNNKSGVTDSEEYVEEIKLFLHRKKAKVKVILENGLKVDKNFPVYQVLKEYRDKNLHGRVEIQDATPGFIEAVKEVFGNNYHFAVADKRMYRVETEPKSFKAICSFNSTSTAKGLNNFFINHYSKLNEG